MAAVPKQTDERIAHHEAGHAVADLRFGFDVLDVTMVRDGVNLGGARPVDGWSDDGEAETFIISLLSGYAAELLLVGDSDTTMESGARGDFADASGVLRRIGRRASMNTWIELALSFVAGEWRAVCAVARELVTRRKLSGDEVALIVDIADGNAKPEALSVLRGLMNGGPA